MNTDPTQGAQQSDPPPPQLTREDLATMTPRQIVAAHDNGLCDDLLTGRHQ